MATRTRGDAESRESAAHRASIESIEDVVGYLVDLLGVSLVAHLTGTNRSTVNRWANAEVHPKADREQALRATAQIARLLATDANYTVRAWFIGMNPQLDDEAPIDVLASGRFKDALVAARAFLAGA